MKSRLGFTILELLIVIAITGLLLGTLPMLTNGTGSFHHQSAIEDILSILREARSAAIERNTEIAVSVDPASRRIASPSRSAAIPASMGEISATVPGLQESSVTRVKFFPDGSSSGMKLAFGCGAEIEAAWLSGKIIFKKE
ncbi:MAG: prepilin-type N-terminal cleavage/methylation domain-containing protein [Alphaproteobacteria bacterium]|nr:prepilin-type N-terminal cleavage/methylation domain-containing protein [Alphaproteobacteria bacterium]